MANPSDQTAENEGVPSPGDVLAGKYQVERVIGVGGMGVVVAAMHLILQERVALKFLLPSVMNGETMARFGREARAAAKIKSEHVARVTDVGVLENGAPFMVMEYLEGKDLSATVREKGPLPIRDAVEYVLHACEAVAEAHALGIVHRDLKPANLFLARRAGGSPLVKVLDFGISKVVARGASLPPQDDDPSVTRTRAWLGSPLYMSPEQMRSARDVDTRTDIWSLGLILYELCTGAEPWDAQSFPELCAQIMHGEPPALEKRRPDAPPGLAAVIRRCAEKDPALRYENVGELAMALVEFAPTRARSAAERAVSALEAAGLMKPTGVKRRPLDGTLPEAVMSPLAAARPALPAPPAPPPRAPGGGGGAPPVTGFERTSRMPEPPAAIDRARRDAASSDRPRRASLPPPASAPAAAARGWGTWIAVAVIVISGIGVGAYLARGRSAEAPALTTAEAPPPSPPASATTVAADLSSAPTAAPVVAATATASAAPAASASAPADAGAPKHDAGRADAGARSGAPTASTRGAWPAPPPPPVGLPPVAPPPVDLAPPPPADLVAPKCWANQPDGSRTPVPCAP